MFAKTVHQEFPQKAPQIDTESGWDTVPLPPARGKMTKAYCPGVLGYFGHASPPNLLKTGATFWKETCAQTCTCNKGWSRPFSGVPTDARLLAFVGCRGLHWISR